MRAYGVAPGKVILAGEHFVVQGAPALVAALRLYSTVTAEERSDSWIEIESTSLGHAARFKKGRFQTIRGGRPATSSLKPSYVLSEMLRRNLKMFKRGITVHIESEIPVGVGLGSSAAIAVSTMAAISKLFHGRIEKERIRKLAYQSETMIHGTPSGIDQTVATYGGIISYMRGKNFTRIKPDQPLHLIIGNTKKTRSTGTMVAQVRRIMDQNAAFKQEIMKSALEISREAIRAVQAGNLKKLGQLMNMNHELLQMVGASTIELDLLTLAARHAGAFGAKMTGAGGGGCMVALSPAGRERKIVQAIMNAGGEAYRLSIDEQGVRAWLSS
ncbi:MAG: mevalonate kinase [archaeon]